MLFIGLLILVGCLFVGIVSTLVRNCKMREVHSKQTSAGVTHKKDETTHF